VARITLVPVILALVALAGCGVTAGGFSLSVLQDASVTLNTGGHNGSGIENEPNGEN